MLQTDVSKLIDGMHYLVDNEQYDALYTQLPFSIPYLVEHGQLDALLTLLDEIFPHLFAQHKVSVARQLLALIMPHISQQHTHIYAKMLYFFGHAYFLIEEHERAIHYYKQSVSYFMKCEAPPFPTIAMALLHLAVLTEDTSSYDTQLSYARIISTFQSMHTTDETPKDIVNKYAFYYETCLRLQRFDEAYDILQQLKALSYTPMSREHLQVRAFEVMYAHTQHDYSTAYALATHILEQFPKQRNITMMLQLYTIAIACAQQLQKETSAQQLQLEHDALKQQLQLQRLEVNEQFPLPATILPGSTPLALIAKHVNEALQQAGTCYTMIVYDVSTFQQQEHITMLQQLHHTMIATFPQPIVYFCAIKPNQVVYVLECGEAHTWKRVEQLIATLPFQPTYGYCHSSKSTVQTFEQLLHMSYAYIYYAHSQKRKVT